MKSIKTLLIMTCVLAIAGPAWSASEMMRVQVKKGDIRDAPSFLGKTVGHVSYGDQVEVLEQKDAWMRIAALNGVNGWIHQSALTRKRVAVSSGGRDEKLPVSKDELALASKGFGADVEAEFRKTHGDIDFTWVDRMERFHVSPQELAAFLSQGGLHRRQTGGAP